MKILITGGTGLLGKALIETAKNSYEITATYIGNYEMSDSGQVKYLKLDIQDKSAYSNLFKNFRPEAVIHTASIGSPDYAQKNREKTWLVNVGGTQNMLSNCEVFGAKFVYVSSNAIYDGKKAPYSESDLAEPINYYGEVKLEGENLTKKSKITYAIVRPILMYGWNYAFERPNVATIALSKLKKGESVNIYEDVFCNPILSEYCAQAIWRLIKNGTYEEFNIGGKDTVSVYELIKVAAEVFDFDSNLIQAVRQGFFKELVRRPENTSYRTAKMENKLGLEPLSIRAGLEIMKLKANKDYA